MIIDLTFRELQEKLLQFDELTLIELLNISAEDIITRFEDKIEDNYDKLLSEVIEDIQTEGD